MQPVTVHSAILFLDEVTLKGGYAPKDWQLQAVCCLSVAAEHEEAGRNMPMASETCIYMNVHTYEHADMRTNARTSHIEP